MASRVEQIEIALKRGFDNKLAKLLAEAVKEKDIETLDILRITIENETKNGFIISEVTKAYFRIKRKDLSDCNPLFDLWHFDKCNC